MMFLPLLLQTSALTEVTKTFLYSLLSLSGVLVGFILAYVEFRNILVEISD